MQLRLCIFSDDCESSLIFLAIYNAYVLYKLKKNVNLLLATYQLELIREIIGKYGSQVRSSIG
jgi:hypothetical protein